MNESVKHSRSTYDLLDLLGDLGGATEVIMIMFGFFIFPFAEYQFTMAAAKRLFLARTTDDSIFVIPNPEKLNKKVFDKKSMAHLPKKVRKELNTHKQIQIGMLDNIKLYLSNSFLV